MTLDEVVAWLDKASETDLETVTGSLIERGFAVHPDDLEALERELVSYEADDERDDGLLEEARSRLQRRDWPEALHKLAAALGRDFDALEAIPLRS